MRLMALVVFVTASMPAFAIAEGAAAPDPISVGQAAPGETPPVESFAEFGRIDVQLRQVRRSNCWTLILRGRLSNSYDEPVKGVRLIVRLRGEGDTPRELGRFETQLGVSIQPGASVVFDRQFSTTCSTGFNDISVVAFASQRGGTELPVATREIEVAASKVEVAASSGGSMSTLNNVGSWGPGVGVTGP